MNGGMKQRRKFTFSVYFMVVLLIAVMFPGFRLLTEWIAPPLFIYPLIAVRIGNMLLLIVALVVIMHLILKWLRILWNFSFKNFLNFI